MRDAFGLEGVMVAATPLGRGLGLAAGLEPAPMAEGELDANLGIDVQTVLDAIATHDLVVLHLAAADLAAHAGDPQRNTDLSIPEKIGISRKRRLVEPDVTIKHLAIQKLDRCRCGISFFHPHDAGVTEPGAQQSEEEQGQQKLFTPGNRRSGCARLLNITGVAQP